MPLSAGVVRKQEGKVALGAIVNLLLSKWERKALRALVGKKAHLESTRTGLQGTKVRGSCGTGVVPDFVSVTGGARGP